MKTRVYLAVLSMLTSAVPGWAALKAVGPPITPHGFPAFYTDNSNLSLELCLPAPVGTADAAMCLFDPVDPLFPALGVGSESFWWMAEATMELGQFPEPGRVPPRLRPARALVVLAMEAAFASEVAVNGSQMTFGRVRIRVDTPFAGDYVVSYPYGTERFTIAVGEEAAGINVTRDVGGIALFDPTAGYAGALASDLGPFLTWSTFNTDPALNDAALKKADPANPTGPLAQYVGDPNVPHAIKGSPVGNNLFRVVGPPGSGIDKTETLFTVMGKVFVPFDPAQPTSVDPARLAGAGFFPPVPPPTLAAVGPVNRTAPADLGPPGTTPLIPPSVPPVDPPVQPPEVVAGPAGFSNTFPVGFPQWFQDANGVRLTICPGGDGKCISALPDDTLASKQLRVGEEAFWWTGESFLNDRTPGVVVPNGLDGILVMALEGAFTGGAPTNGEQMAFSRIRVRVDVPVAGTYTITHPYGQEVFENVDPEVGINMTRDIMMTSPVDPDAAFAGALFGDVGPFLTWTTFNPDPALTDPLLKRTVGTDVIQYVGDPTVDHAVTGSPTGNNFFRIQGPAIDVQTNLFAVSGKVFAPATFGGETGTNPTTGAPLGFGGIASGAAAPDTSIPVTAPGTTLPSVPGVGPGGVPIGGGSGGGGGGGGCFIGASGVSGMALPGWLLGLGVALGALLRRRRSE